jgi:hypothetical protein
MRTSIFAVMVAFGTATAVPALAQQSSTSGQQTQPDQQMQQEADKGIMTRNSGESGFVGNQEKPGVSARVPGRPDSSSNQTTTGSSSGPSSGRGSDAGGNPR